VQTEERGETKKRSAIRGEKKRKKSEKKADVT